MILCTGSNYFGQLGVGSTSSRDNANVPINFGRSDLDPSEVEDIQCGGHFTVLRFKDGTLQACGAVNGTVCPLLTPISLSIPLKCVQVSCGRRHIVALLERHIVMSWGSGCFGQLGHGDDRSWDSPRIVSFLQPKRLGANVKSVVCGGSHSGVVTEAGTVYMWGLNRKGQCAQTEDVEYALLPRLVHSISDYAPDYPSMVACGRSHSAAVLMSGRVLMWGESAFGRLGIPGMKKIQYSPLELTYFHNLPVASIALGDLHSLALTVEGDVYSWGCNTNGQTGHLMFVDVRIPRKVEYFSNRSVRSINCGSTWSMAVTKSGILFTWGYGGGGWLGLNPPIFIRCTEKDRVLCLPPSHDSVYSRCFDSNFDVLIPQQVMLPPNLTVVSTSAGDGHMVVIVQPATLKHSSVVEPPASMQQVTTSERFPTGRLVSSKYDSKDNDSLPTVDNKSALIFSCCRHKNIPELMRLICRGVDVNAQDSAGNTPLIVACQNGHMVVCKVLVQHGASVMSCNNNGNTALHYCFNYGYDDIGKYLILCGADEFHVNGEGLTCYEGLTHSDLDLI